MELSVGIILKMVLAVAVAYILGRFPYSKPRGIIKSILRGALVLVVLWGAISIFPVWLVVAFVALGGVNYLIKTKKVHS